MNVELFKGYMMAAGIKAKTLVPSWCADLDALSWALPYTRHSNHNRMEGAIHKLQRRFVEKYGSIDGTTVLAHPSPNRIGWIIHRYYRICA